MAKTSRPVAHSPRAGSDDPPSARLAHTSSGVGQAEAVMPSPEQRASEARRSAPRPERVDREYLITGTGCLAGHEPDQVFQGGLLGELPTRRTTWIGLALVFWAMFGLAILGHWPWVNVAFTAAILWLAFSMIIQFRGGHRGRCWRTRSWRYAWGGLVPSMKDPTRESDDE